MSESPRIVHEPDPDNPGWFTWNLADDTRFNAQTMGHMLVRKDSDRLCRVRMFPERRHTNLLDMVHGAISLALMDVALFASMRLLLDANRDEQTPLLRQELFKVDQYADLAL